MTGDEMKALRLSTGLSQAKLATAIGMSRESVGRMERSGEVIEKRTELALRYIALRGGVTDSRFDQVHDDVERVLDDAAIRANPSGRRTERLKQALEEWTAGGGSEAGRQLIYRAQGVVGLINVTALDDGTWTQIMRDLTQLKAEWAAVRQ